MNYTSFYYFAYLKMEYISFKKANDKQTIYKE